ncbi:MAG: type II secretion system protein [Candidatus Pacebacteria bacterium]|nr:type II secretion system protein [Candidatus Paceibacterota bacterium]
MQLFEKKNRGFTLIELLVVIAIIGILASIVLVSLGGARAKARDAQRQSDMRQIVTAQEMYYGDSSVYFQSGATAGTSTFSGITGYLDAIDDPQPTTKDYIWVNNDYDITDCTQGDYFCAYAALEGGNYFAASEKGTKTVSALPEYGSSDCVCW